MKKEEIYEKIPPQLLDRYHRNKPNLTLHVKSTRSLILLVSKRNICGQESPIRFISHRKNKKLRNNTLIKLRNTTMYE